MNESIISIEPNAARLIESLRSSGYSNEAAIADLVDNALDAGAKTVHVTVGDDWLTIQDDGRGMDKDTLLEAMKLGSDTDRVAGDLGKFGMGLVTASISLGRRVEITTRESDVVHFGVQDIDYIIEKKAFKMKYSTLDDKSLANPGTILAIKNIDRYRNKPETLATNLHRELGRIFRFFIWGERKLYVNGELVVAIDPLFEDVSESRINSDEMYDIGGKRFRIKVALLPDYGTDKSKELRINQFTQGFYLVRNNREIASGQTFDLWTRHNRYNRIRIEMQFDDSLDHEMGVEYKKDNINISHPVLSKLRDTVVVEVNHLVNTMQRAKKPAGDMGVDHNESMEHITSKSKLLILPEVPKEKRKSPVNKVEPTTPLELSGETRQPRKVQPGGIPRVYIGEANLGRLGELFEAYPEGRKLVVNWNVDHPFYQRILVAYRDDANVVTAMDYLAYSLGAAEVQLGRTDDGRELVDQFKTISSQNIRTLLG